MTESIEARVLNLEQRMKRLERALLNKFERKKQMEDNLINITE